MSATTEVATGATDWNAAETAESFGSNAALPPAGGGVNVGVADDDAAADALRSLHEDAVRVAKANRGKLPGSIQEQERRRAEEFGVAASRATRAQDLIIRDIKAGLRERVMAAANDGFHSVNILEFNGFDQYAFTDERDGTTTSFLYVFLVLGPRAHEHKERQYMTTFGYRPLMDRLRDELGLFGIKHYHVRSTNTNQVRIAWGRRR